MKIIHIHTDIKFINLSNLLFRNDKFINTVIFLGKLITVDDDSENEKDWLYYSVTSKNLKIIIDLCKNVDLVVLYNLDGVKSYIANRLPPNVKIIWRFFGMELYSKMPYYVFSDITAKLIRDNEVKQNKNNSIWNKKIRPILIDIKWRTDFKNEFEKALKRIDYFLGLSEVEYIFLKKYWPNLPSFMQIPFSFIESKKIRNKQKSNKIIIGNNRSKYNNHLDILRLIKKFKNKDNYIIKLLFNYGNYDEYAHKVRKEVIKIEGISLIEEIMPFDKYQIFFLTIDAFVLNGYRQMAMRAVFESLTSGVKVYLNKKNIILQWLKKEGFLIYSMEDFSNDMANDNLYLSQGQVKYNMTQFEKFRFKYNIEDFHKRVLDQND